MTKLEKLLRQFNHRCDYCGVVVILCDNPGNDRMATTDHCIPVTRGGGRDEPNRVLACMICNNVKGDMTAPEFRLFLESGCLAQSYIAYLEARLAKRLKVRFAEIPVAAMRQAS